MDPRPSTTGGFAVPTPRKRSSFGEPALASCAGDLIPSSTASQPAQGGYAPRYSNGGAPPGDGRRYSNVAGAPVAGAPFGGNPQGYGQDSVSPTYAAPAYNAAPPAYNAAPPAYGGAPPYQAQQGYGNSPPDYGGGGWGGGWGPGGGAPLSQIPTTRDGYRINEDVIHEDVRQADHVKDKNLGGYQAHFSSPFEFSSSEREAARTWEVQETWEVQQVQPGYGAGPPPSGFQGGPGPQGGDFGLGQQTTQVFTQHVHQQQGSAPVTMQWQSQWQGPPPNRGPPPQSGYQSAPPPQQPQPPPQGPKPAIEGWLSKRGKDFGENWRQRWCSLQNGVLTYSKTERGAPDGSIQLNERMTAQGIASPNASVEGRVMKHKHPFAFEIYTGQGVRTWYLDGATQQKMDIWVNCVRQEIDKLRMNAGLPPAGGPCGPPSGRMPPSGQMCPPSGWGPPPGSMPMGGQMPGSMPMGGGWNGPPTIPPGGYGPPGGGGYGPPPGSMPMGGGYGGPPGGGYGPPGGGYGGY